MKSWHEDQLVTAIHYTQESTELMHDKLEPEPALSPLMSPRGMQRRASWLRNALAATLKLIGGVSFVLFVGGVCAYMTPLYQTYVQPRIAAWWGSHDEMVDPTYLLLVGVVPTLVCVVVMQWLRNLSVRRGTWRMAMVCRQRPRADWISYGEILFLTILVSVNALVFWYTLTQRHHHKPGPPGPPHLSGDHKPPSALSVRSIGHALGFNSVLNLVLLFLPATRNSAWMEFLDISYVNGIKYHRWLGVAAVLTGFIHGACYYWCWLSDGQWSKMALPCWDCSLRDRMGRKIWINVFGEVAGLCFVLIGITSIPWVRRKMYNMFYYVHQLLFLAVAFTVLHWARALWFILPAFVGYLVSRVLSHCNGEVSTKVVQFSALSPTLCKLVIAFSPCERGTFEVGQFVYVNVPAISRLQWHAFTIASSPRSLSYDGASTNSMVLLIKSLGDWTEKLMAYAQECESTNVEPEVYVDGYYGASLNHITTEYETVVLVGGGVGVTPFLGVLEDICTAAEARLVKGRNPFRQHTVVIFAMRELELLKEMFPLLMRIRDLDPRGRYVSVNLTLTTTPRPDELDSSLCGDAIRPKKAVKSYSDSKPRACRASGRHDQPCVSSLGFKGSWMIQFVAFGVVVGLVLVLQFGDGVLVDFLSDSVWVVKVSAKILALFAAVICVHGGIVLVQWSRDAHVACSVVRSRSLIDNKEVTQRLLSCTQQESDTVAGVSTFRDLVSELQVSVGKRPDLEVHLRELQFEHRLRCRNNKLSIGVIVSGPAGLKTATARAIASVGASDFDMREEEFEL